MKRALVFLVVICLSLNGVILFAGEGKAASDNYWIADTAKNANDPTAWSLGVVPGTGDNIFFTSAHNGNCNWNLAGTFGNFTVSGYTGTITQAANFTVKSFSMSSGTFTGSRSYWLTTTSGFSKSGGTITSYYLQWKVNGTQTYYSYGYVYFYSFHLYAGILSISSSTYNGISTTYTRGSVKMEAGTELVIPSGKNFVDYGYSYGGCYYKGKVSGAGNYYFISVSSQTSHNMPNMAEGVWTISNIYISTDVTGTTKTITFTSSWTLTGNLRLYSGNASTTTYDLAGYSLSVGALTIYSLAVLKGSTSTITCSGNWTSTNGTFTCDTSTVILSGTSTITTTSANAFYNLQITGSATMASDVTCSNMLTIGAGASLNASTYTLVLYSYSISGSLNVSSATLELRASVTSYNITPVGTLRINVPYGSVKPTVNITVNSGFELVNGLWDDNYKTLTTHGSFTVTNGMLNNGTLTLVMDGTGTINLSGLNSGWIMSLTMSNNITVAGSATVKANYITNSGTVTINSGTKLQWLIQDNEHEFNNTGTIGGSGTLEFYAYTYSPTGNRIGTVNCPLYVTTISTYSGQHNIEFIDSPVLGSTLNITANITNPSSSTYICLYGASGAGLTVTGEVEIGTCGRIYQTGGAPTWYLDGGLKLSGSYANFVTYSTVQISNELVLVNNSYAYFYGSAILKGNLDNGGSISGTHYDSSQLQIDMISDRSAKFGYLSHINIVIAPTSNISADKTLTLTGFTNLLYTKMTIYSMYSPKNPKYVIVDGQNYDIYGNGTNEIGYLEITSYCVRLNQGSGNWKFRSIITNYAFEHNFTGYLLAGYYTGTYDDRVIINNISIQGNGYGRIEFGGYVTIYDGEINNCDLTFVAFGNTRLQSIDIDFGTTVGSINNLTFSRRVNFALANSLEVWGKLSVIEDVVLKRKSYENALIVLRRDTTHTESLFRLLNSIGRNSNERIVVKLDSVSINFGSEIYGNLPSLHIIGTGTSRSTVNMSCNIPLIYGDFEIRNCVLNSGNYRIVVADSKWFICVDSEINQGSKIFWFGAVNIFGDSVFNQGGDITVVNDWLQDSGKFVGAPNTKLTVGGDFTAKNIDASSFAGLQVSGTFRATADITILASSTKSILAKGGEISGNLTVNSGATLQIGTETSGWVVLYVDGTFIGNGIIDETYGDLFCTSKRRRDKSIIHNAGSYPSLSNIISPSIFTPPKALVGTARKVQKPTGAYVLADIPPRYFVWWHWYQYPYALYANGRTFFSYWAMYPCTNYLSIYNHNTKKWTTKALTGYPGTENCDAHYAGQINMSPSGKLHVWYGAHVMDHFRHAILSPPYETGTLEEEQIYIADRITYPVGFNMPNNKIGLIFRGTDTNYDHPTKMAIGPDGLWGDDFTTKTLVDFGNDFANYHYVWVNEKDIYLAIALHRYSPIDTSNAVILLISHDYGNTWETIDGTNVPIPLTNYNEAQNISGLFVWKDGWYDSPPPEVTKTGLYIYGLRKFRDNVVLAGNYLYYSSSYPFGYRMANSVLSWKNGSWSFYRLGDMIDESSKQNVHGCHEEASDPNGDNNLCALIMTIPVYSDKDGDWIIARTFHSGESWHRISKYKVVDGVPVYYRELTPKIDELPYRHHFTSATLVENGLPEMRFFSVLCDNNDVVSEYFPPASSILTRSKNYIYYFDETI